MTDLRQVQACEMCLQSLEVFPEPFGASAGIMRNASASCCVQCSAWAVSLQVRHVARRHRGPTERMAGVKDSRSGCRNCSKHPCLAALAAVLTAARELQPAQEHKGELPSTSLLTSSHRRTKFHGIGERAQSPGGTSMHTQKSRQAFCPPLRIGEGIEKRLARDDGRTPRLHCLLAGPKPFHRHEEVYSFLLHRGLWMQVVKAGNARLRLTTLQELRLPPSNRGCLGSCC